MLDLDIEQGDFCNAFLNDTLSDSDNIFMSQPEGHVLDPDLVCYLHKSLYGLKQGARQWYACLHQCLTSFGMQRISTDQAIWVAGQLILLAHVDYVLMVGASQSLTQHISSHYQFKELGPASLYTGIYIIRDRANHRLYLDQAPYINGILDEFCMSNCVPSVTPMDPRASWDPQSSDTPMDDPGRKLYQRAIGQLMYLMLASRPDIAYALTKLAQFGSCPTMRHWDGVLRIMRYLRKHDSVRLCLGSNSTQIAPSLIGYFDASLMDCAQSRKSTGAYIFFYTGSCISWASKKQGLVALSSTEAEFIPRTEAAKELAWIISFLEDISAKPEDLPILCGDNRSTLALAKDNIFRPRTKYIHARERLITQMVQSGQCTLRYVPTNDMFADALTKPLSRERHELLVTRMGLILGNTNRQQCKK